MNEMSAIIVYGYDHNSYNTTRKEKMDQQDNAFIDASFERMVENSIPYIDDEKMRTYKPKILELGCGIGVPYTKYLSRLGKVVGCDISSNQIGCARKNVPEARFIHKDAMELHLGLKYDMIVMIDAFDHISYTDKPVLLGKMKYWLKPYGVIVLSTYGDITKYRSVADFYGNHMIWNYTSSADFEKMVTQAGLAVIEQELRVDAADGSETYLWALQKV